MTLAIYDALQHVSGMRVHLWFVIHMKHDDLFFFPNV